MFEGLFPLPLLDLPLTGRKLPTRVCVMSKETDWFSSLADRRVTVVEIAKILGVTRRTATNRLDNGLSANDVIDVARGLDINPVTALQELGHVTIDEVYGYLDRGGVLLETAPIEEVVYRLAEESLPAKLKVELASTVAAQVDDLAERRKRNAMSDPGGTIPEGAAADSSPDEDARREEGDWTDPDNIP